MTANSSERAPAQDRYRLLLETSQRLSTKVAADDLYEAIYRETAQVLDGTGFYLALYDQSRDLARVVFYADGDATHHVELVYRASDSEVFRTRRPSLVEDELEDGSLLVLGEEGGPVPRSAITAPVVLNGRMLGAISVQSDEPGAFSGEDLDLLQELAGVVAVALQTSLQFQELEQRRSEAEQLEEIGRVLTAHLDPDEVLQRVISAVQEILHVDGTAVWLRDGHAPVCRVAGSGGDIALPVDLEWELSGEIGARLEHAHKPVILDDLRTNATVPPAVAEHMTGGSAIGVPVVVNGLLEGVLTAGSRQPRHFTEEDTGVLQRLANQFAVALGNARLHADLHRLSLLDPLTGLPNRRRLQIHLDHEVAAARRGRPLGIAMIDIDRFKHYNDTFGHVAGDQILKAVGAILSEENRAMNIVARYGGDEFVSVLSDTGLEGVRHYAERVQHRVAHDEILKGFGITVSIGGAEFDPDGMASVNDVLRAADADMYETKGATLREQAAG